jgi:NMD protein affecting ribosome stability and mRNA decay
LIAGNDPAAARRTMESIPVVRKEAIMKASTRSHVDARHLPRLPSRNEDSYRAAEKPPEPATCSDCGAVFHRGRWSWGRIRGAAQALRCPACLRIQDHYPAGYLSMKGEFAQAHRDELLDLVRSRAERERLEHPLERLMGVDAVADGIVVTTTGTHLARALAQAVKAAYDGRLVTRYAKDENQVRVTWRR